MASFDQFLSPEEVQLIHNEFLARTAPPGLYDRIDPGSFRDEAEEDVSPYIEKDLDLALKEINLQREQRKQVKEQAEKFQGQQESQYFRVQDKNFARALQGAQGGFAGRGTTNSGFRNRGIDDLQTDENEKLEEQRRSFAQATEGRNLGFEQFLNQSNLTEEQTRLETERQRKREIAERQGQLFDQESARQGGAQAEVESRWKDFISLNNSLAA